MNKYNIFWHVCSLNNWLEVVEDQLKSIVDSGLINIIDKIYINFLGNSKHDIDFLTKQCSKIYVVNYTDNYKDYERSCLHCLLDWSQNNESNILYMHTKGVSRPENNNVWNWRKLLEKHLIYNHKNCIDKLQDYDIVGINFLDQGKKEQKILNENHCAHFSGNFWWSKTSYIRILPKIRPDIINLSKNNLYWLCERWIMLHYPSVKYYEILSTEHKKYYKSSPKLKYL